MIDIDLINKSPDIESYVALNANDFPILFLGFIIKNEYDNQRVKIVESFSPISFCHFSKDKQYFVALKGIKLTPNSNVKSLIKSILNQEKLGINLTTYQNLLNQYGFACKETYNLFDQGFYPIDFNNLKSVCDDSFNTDKKIFQHILGIDEKVFDFQKFSSLRLVILTI